MVQLTFKSIDVRPVLVPLARPVVSRVGLYEQWPLILIDLHTEEGIVGRSYLAPYLRRRYATSCRRSTTSRRRARASRSPRSTTFAAGPQASLGLVGLEGVSMIAVSGLDMAAWDALAKAAGLPLAVHLGGSLAPVPAYNSGGLWLTPLEEPRQGSRSAGGRGWLSRGQAAARARTAGRRPPGDRDGARGARRRRQAHERLQPGAVARRRAASLPRPRRSGPLLVRGADRLRRLLRLRASSRAS